MDSILLDDESTPSFSLKLGYLNILESSKIINEVWKWNKNLDGKVTFSAAMAEGDKLTYEEAMAETRKWLEERHE